MVICSYHSMHWRPVTSIAISLHRLSKSKSYNSASGDDSSYEWVVPKDVNSSVHWKHKTRLYWLALL